MKEGLRAGKKVDFSPFCLFATHTRGSATWCIRIKVSRCCLHVERRRLDDLPRSRAASDNNGSSEELIDTALRRFAGWLEVEFADASTVYLFSPHVRSATLGLSTAARHAARAAAPPFTRSPAHSWFVNRREGRR
tara:strand:- start:210 stop:614 length:405 start_codon:yes stop_codon:yes gene_type:complete